MLTMSTERDVSNVNQRQTTTVRETLAIKQQAVQYRIKTRHLGIRKDQAP